MNRVITSSLIAYRNPSKPRTPPVPFLGVYSRDFGASDNLFRVPTTSLVASAHNFHDSEVPSRRGGLRLKRGRVYFSWSQRSLALPIRCRMDASFNG